MSSDFDVVVAGGGHVGASLALALKQADPRLAVAVVDPTPPQAGPDARASAIAAAARRMLERLGVWDEIAPHAQPIVDMIVTDSSLDAAVRPVFLTFDGALTTGEPFAHMVPNAAMVGALLAASRAAGVELLMPDRVTGFDVSDTAATVRLASGRTLRAGLPVAADGVRSRLRDLAGIGTVK